MLVLSLAALPAGTATTIASGRPSLTVFSVPFQTVGVTTAWPGVEQFDGFKGGVAPVEQFLRLIGAVIFAGCAQHDGQQTAAARRCASTQTSKFALGCGDQAVAGGIGVAGFQAIDRGVAKQQQIAVAVVGGGRAGVAVFLDGVVADVLGEIGHQAGGQHAQIARGGGVAGFGQAFGVFVAGVFHAQQSWPARSSAAQNARTCRPRPRPAPWWHRCPTARSCP